MPRNVIAYQEDLIDLCNRIRECGLVAFDTEFVSDAGYRPALGLLQFATRDESVAVDPLAVESLAPWWDLMCDDSTVVVCHGAQAEIRFCLNATGSPPARLVDLQIAEGLRGRAFPLSYSAIVQRVLDKRVVGNQTRTDWLRRPLSHEQIRYALEDVDHVLEIWRRQEEWLTQNGRIDWAWDEFDRMVSDVAGDERTPAWKRLSGLHKLSRRDLLVAQRLATWREEEAAFHNRPVRRILRDDLLLDLARRKPTTVQQALATRDLNRSEYRRRMDSMVEVIQEALRVADEDLPAKYRGGRAAPSSDEQVLTRILSLALANRCAELEIAQSLTANNKDLAALIRFHHGDRSTTKEDVRLLNGWRGEVCGDLLRDVLDGKVAFRVAPAGSETPLQFEWDSRDVPE